MIDDRDAAGPNRNVQGPNIVRRLPRASWPAYMHRIEDALIAQGVPSHAKFTRLTTTASFRRRSVRTTSVRPARAAILPPRRGRGRILK